MFTPRFQQLLRVLGWPIPQRILDPYVEFRVQTCGLSRPFGSGLLGALAYHGLDSNGAEEKQYWRDKVMSGGPWSDEDRAVSWTIAKTTLTRWTACRLRWRGGSNLISIDQLTRGTQIPMAPAGPPYVLLSALSFTRGFRTPAAELAAPFLEPPAS